MKAIVYETGGAERMPLAMLNRYPGQIIGVAFRLPRRALPVDRMEGREVSDRTTACDHNVIPIRVRFRSRWICVRCDQVFSTPPPRHVLMDADTFAHLLSEGDR